jgi:hypothetical protein
VEAEMEGGRTNYLLNSSFEADSNDDGVANGWGTYVYGGGTGTSSMSNKESTYDNGSYLLDKTNSLGQLYAVQTVSTTPGSTYTYSCWVNSNTTSALIDISHDSVWSATYVSSNKLNQWTRLSTTFTNTTTTTSTVRVAIYGALGTAYFDSCQLEVGAFASSYIPTVASVVARNADVATVPTTNWDTNQGTIMVVAEPITRGRYVSWIGPTLAINLYRASGNQIQGVLGGTPTYTASKTGTFVSSAAMTWVNGGSLVAYMDGLPGTATTDVATTSLPSTAYIGGYSGYDYIYGPMQRALVYSSSLSASDITSVTNSVKDGP